MDQLAYFQCVAETKNFTQAAERMNLSQPALSRSIQRLEEELGQPLFERQSRSVELTEAGLLFHKRAEQILLTVEDAKAEICDDGQSGRIRVGAITTIAPYFLPEFLREFADAFPKANLVVQEDVTENLIKRCKQGELDVAILALPIPVRYLEVEELDDSDRRVYRSFHGSRPTRSVAALWNPYRFQSRLLQAFRKDLRCFAKSFAKAR